MLVIRVCGCMYRMCSGWIVHVSACASYGSFIYATLKIQNKRNETKLKKGLGTWTMAYFNSQICVCIYKRRCGKGVEKQLQLPKVHFSTSWFNSVSSSLPPSLCFCLHFAVIALVFAVLVGINLLMYIYQKEERGQLLIGGMNHNFFI